MKIATEHRITAVYFELTESEANDLYNEVYRLGRHLRDPLDPRGTFPVLHQICDGLHRDAKIDGAG